MWCGVRVLLAMWCGEVSGSQLQLARRSYAPGGILMDL